MSFIHRYHTEFDEAVDTIDPGYSLAFFIAEAYGGRNRRCAEAFLRTGLYLFALPNAYKRSSVYIFVTNSILCNACYYITPQQASLGRKSKRIY